MVQEYRHTFDEKLYDLNIAAKERQQVKEWITMMKTKYKYEEMKQKIRFTDKFDEEILKFANHLQSNVT